MANETDNTGIAGLKNQPTASSYTIDELYRQALGREADPEGLKYWTQQLGPTAEGKEIADFLSGAGYELMRTRYDPFSQQATTPAQSYKVEDLYQKALGREADPYGLKYWQETIGPTAEGEEIAKFLQAAQPELEKTKYTPFSGDQLRQSTGNPYLDYQMFMREQGLKGKTPQQIADEKAMFDKYYVKQEKYLSNPNIRRTPEDIARRAKPNAGEFMGATGLDWETASDLLYGIIGSNQDTRDWAKIMASKDPYQAARAATAQMYGGPGGAGYGLQIGGPDGVDVKGFPRAYLTSKDGQRINMLGRYDANTNTIDMSPKQAADAYNRFGVDLGALLRRSGVKVAPRYDPTTSPYNFSELINYLLGGKG